MTVPAATAEPTARDVVLTTGLTYRVLEWGGADPSLDHTVVVLHGFLDFAWSWARVVDAGLSGRFHVVVPDLRGHGDSDWIGAGGYYHFLDYLADLDDLIEKLGRGRVSLVGHSMGGSIASYFTGAFPTRIASLALLEGTGPPEQTTPMPDRVVAWLTGCRRVRSRPRNDYGSVAEAAAQLRRHDRLLDQPLALELAARATIAAADGRLRFKHDPLHATSGPYPFRLEVAESFWRRIPCPVLLVEGSESPFRHPRPQADRRRACFADVRQAELAGAGHMMHRHRPAELAALLAEFLHSAR